MIDLAVTIGAGLGGLLTSVGTAVSTVGGAVSTFLGSIGVGITGSIGL